ncbi:unnamed protein product, partial [marine sediment metagenome]
LTYRLTPNDEIREYYPFDFQLDITYQLTGNELTMTFAITNTEKNRDIYFCFGWHPGFKAPIVDGKGKKTDCQILFKKGTYTKYHNNEACRRSGGDFDFAVGDGVVFVGVGYDEQGGGVGDKVIDDGVQDGLPVVVFFAVYYADTVGQVLDFPCYFKACVFGIAGVAEVAHHEKQFTDEVEFVCDFDQAVTARSYLLVFELDSAVFQVSAFFLDGMIAVVGQKREWEILAPQFLNKFSASGKRCLSGQEHAVYV